jgi:hypothetical protein
LVNVQALRYWHKREKTGQRAVDSRMEMWLKLGLKEVLGSNEFGMNTYLFLSDNSDTQAVKPRVRGDFMMISKPRLKKGGFL